MPPKRPPSYINKSLLLKTVVTLHSIIYTEFVNIPNFRMIFDLKIQPSILLLFLLPIMSIRWKTTCGVLHWLVIHILKVNQSFLQSLTSILDIEPNIWRKNYAFKISTTTSISTWNSPKLMVLWRNGLTSLV